MNTLKDFSSDVDRKLESILVETRNKIRIVRKNIAKEEAQMRITGAEGDLSENAGFQVSKQNLGRYNDEARILSAKESTLTKFIQEGNSSNRIEKATHVSVGSVIVIEKKNDDASPNYTFKIVPATLGDSPKGILGVDSPVGKKVLGRKVNDSIIAITRTGEVEYLIKEIY